MQEKNSLLLLHCDAFCYGSTRYFAQCIAEVFERIGWQVTQAFCEKQNPCLGLKPFYGKSYTAILDVNSVLPAARDEDSEYCLNRIAGQVWHYILDHPFYHNKVLQAPLSDYHVICLDRRHADFVKTYYPQIKDAVCLPLAATPSKELIPYDKRKIDVLFTGTYTESDVILYAMLKRPKKEQEIFQQLTDGLMQHPNLTLEEMACKLTTETDIPAFLQEHHEADMFLRAVLREELLVQLLKADIPVTVCGHNWEEFARKVKRTVPGAEKNLKIMGEVPYGDLPDIYANAKIALNQLPWFKDGMHDRIALALMNGSVCLTDESDYLSERFLDGQELYFYPLENMEEAAKLAGQILNLPDDAAKTAARGYKKAVESLTWKAFALTLAEEMTR